MVYQPFARLSDGAPQGAEVLLRWTHPRLGRVLPLEFVALLEADGGIVPVGDWVLRTACARLGQWRDEGLDLRLAVNLAPAQLRPGVDRRAFVARLIAAVPQALVVTGLGSAAYDVYAAGDRDRNYYLWGVMGGASALGLGLALAQPDRPVVVVTGDGEMLMGIGSLGTIGAKRPRNLAVVVLDNGHYGETGMQRSHTSRAALALKPF